jgi:hypothetical protein
MSNHVIHVKSCQIMSFMSLVIGNSVKSGEWEGGGGSNMSSKALGKKTERSKKNQDKWQH